nr:ribosome recycling factor [Pelagibacteraceae bacterium]
MNLDDLNKKMDGSIKHLEKEFQTIRTSRASPSMLENIFIDAYGTKTPLNQLGNISTPDSSMLTIQVWDTSHLKNIENSILESNLGINPQIEGALIRLPIPKLSEERRDELTKIA